MPRRKWTDVEEAAELRDALVDLGRAIWAYLQRTYPTERVYAFGFYTTPDAGYFSPTAAGEDGLDRATAEYAAEGHGDDREGLRWSMADSPLTAELQDELTRLVEAVAAVLDQRGDIHDMPQRAAARDSALRLDAATDALRRLDAEGLFGTEADRRRLTLLLEGGDVSSDWTLKYVRRLNPPAVVQAFAEPLRVEMIGRFTEHGRGKVYDTSAITLGGGQIVIADDDVLTAFKADDFSRAWRCPTRDMSGIRALATSADGSQIVALGRGSSWKHSAAIVVDGAGTTTSSLTIPGISAKAVTLAPDGGWIAASFERSSAVVTPEGDLLAELPEKANARSRSLAVTPDGVTLIAADGASVRLFETVGWTQVGELGVAADSVSLDASGRTLVTALEADWRDETQGGVAEVWDLPRRERRRELRLAGEKIGRAVPSPDGQRVVCAVGDRGRPSHNQAVLLDIADGRELARLSADYEAFYDFVFLPNGDVAVIGRGLGRKPLLVWHLDGVGS